MTRITEIDDAFDLKELFAASFAKTYRELHRTATIRGIRAAKLRKMQKNGQ